ncbi:pirin family protein [Haloechinothrix halophila]|uniref:pirin family protein n=1 Tax=Haloechinothrix halophila TaxID=1069073 RepID=UPI00054EB4C1|nr:pirin family protein [Haloechinothrix halophila]
MSNVETDPIETRCRARVESAEPPEAPAVEIVTSREVPLGGTRAMRVRRTLPQRARSLIGAWCFADRYGPEDVRDVGGMVVPPHPHTGLQTVSWLFSGEIEHRDSSGVRALVEPGELNLMTGGHGICHSEVSTQATSVLHGVQLWVALPEAHRNADRDFQHHVPGVAHHDGADIRVFLGSLAGMSSPVRTFTPLVGAEVTLAPESAVELDVDAAFEHGVLVDQGPVTVSGTSIAPAQLGYVGIGATCLRLANPSAEPARVVLLGGAPFDEDIVMWWNFVARSHDEIVRFQHEWQQESERFGQVDGYVGDPARLPAPPLPKVRLRPRRRAGR